MQKRLQYSTGCMTRLWGLPVAWVAGLVTIIYSTETAQSQVIPATQGAGTTVTSQGNQYDIADGTQAGGNLFHSFDSFNLDQSQTANFLSDSSVLNIVGQVSGLKPSYIDGRVQVEGSDANLYLVNPAGILFGPNTQLSLPGSLTATTADQIEFGAAWLNVLADRNDYAALTADPSAFRFTAANSQGSALVNQGDLTVGQGESLVLMGGSVTSTGSLSAPGGEVGLVAVGGDRTLRFALPGSLLSLEVDSDTFLPGDNGQFEVTSLPALLTGKAILAPVRPIANELTVNADGSGTLLSGADISGGGVAVSGLVSTQSASSSTADVEAAGGTVVLLGDTVDLINAEIEASGEVGGAVHVGRSFNGGDDGGSDGSGAYGAPNRWPIVRQTVFDEQSSIRAQGRLGEGGTVDIWSDLTASASGKISVQGATAGGTVETSAQRLDVNGLEVDARGQTQAGKWLVESLSVAVSDAGGRGQVAASAIASVLDSGTDVEVSTREVDSGNSDVVALPQISLLTSIEQSGASNANLTFTGSRFDDNGHQINLASTGQLTFNIHPLTFESSTGSSSIENAIAAIGDVKGDRLIRLGAGTYDFPTDIDIATNIAIEGRGADAAATRLQATTNGRHFNVLTGHELGLSNVTLTTAGLAPGSFGGGVFNQGKLQVVNSHFIDNRSPINGGAIDSVGATSILAVSDSEFIKNQAALGGGAIAVSEFSAATLERSTFVGNLADSTGGGLFNLGGSKLVNTTFSGNVAANEGGAIYTSGPDANLSVRNSTLSRNAANVGGGGIVAVDTQGASLLNTIVAGNTSVIAADVSGHFTDQGNNLIGIANGATGLTNSRLVGTAQNPLDPRLDLLADNGGFTRTHLPLADSIALNTGGDSALPVTDQRGLVRLSGSAVDIGAVEVAVSAVSPNPAEEEVPTTVSGVTPTVTPTSIPAATTPAVAATVAPTLVPIVAPTVAPTMAPTVTPTLMPTVSTTGTPTSSKRNPERFNRGGYSPMGSELMSDNVSIRRLEAFFGDGFGDYWDLSTGPDLSFDEVQSILQRAQDTYQVNSAVVYAMFSPADETVVEREESTSNLLHIESADDLLQLSLVMPAGELLRYQLPVTRREAERQVRLLRSTVSDLEDSASYRPLSAQLYDWLLAPLEADLAAQGIHNLMYALDKGLRTAPITAMKGPDGFALERYGMSVVPSMGLMQVDFPASVRRLTVAMGVAEFDRQLPLPAVPIELEMVNSTVPVSQTILNEETTLETLERVQAMKQPGILHLATHATFDPHSPETSSIQLWDESLSMADFSRLDWAGSDLDLLILSACSTALSSPQAELGFAGLAAAAGVDATVGSLWQVSDVGTLALMSEFYAQLESTDLRFEALRRAQLALLKKQTRIEAGNLITSQGDVTLPDDWNLPDAATLEHPFFWSAFTMVGNPW